MTDSYNKKVTIYNDIPADAVNPRSFHRFVIDKCNIQGGFVSKTDGTIQNIVNSQTVITKDVEHYKTPLDYATVPADLKDFYFTAQIGDFIVFDEVDDIVTTSKEFSALQGKYKGNGMVITNAVANINGMSVDNVTMTNMG